MRFSIPPAYAEFFSTHKILELEELLSETQANVLCKKLEEHVFPQKPNFPPTNLELWKSGKNLWKEDAEIKKILFNLRLGEIANILFKTRPIRLAFSQTLFTGEGKDLVFAEPLSLTEISSASPLLGGICLCLSPPTNGNPLEEKTMSDFLDLKYLSAFFFAADYKIPFPDLFLQKNARYLFLALSPQGVRYTLQAKDPFTHDLKKEGFVFGDLLSEEISPYLHK